MSKLVLTGDGRDTIISTIANALETNFNVSSAVFTNISKLVLNDTFIGEELIFNETATFAEVGEFMKGRIYKMMPSVLLLDENLGLLKLPENNTIHKEGNTTAKNASELQPINANIDEITAPTTKGVANSNGTEDITVQRMEDMIRAKRLQRDFESLLHLLRSVYYPIFAYYNALN